MNKIVIETVGNQLSLVCFEDGDKAWMNTYVVWFMLVKGLLTCDEEYMRAMVEYEVEKQQSVPIAGHMVGTPSARDFDPPRWDGWNLFERAKLFDDPDYRKQVLLRVWHGGVWADEEKDGD